jgi:PKD repeat protein
VTIQGRFQLITPILSAVFGGQTIPLHASATAQVEYLPDVGAAVAPPAPNPNCSANPTTITAGESVTFTDSSTGSPTQWTWDFGDGTAASTEQNPTHQYMTAGHYTVRLTAINLTATVGPKNCASITVNAAAVPTPTPAVTPTPTPACIHPPNVIGDSPSTANAKFSAWTWKGYVSSSDMTTGPKNKIQAQNPDSTQCVIPSDWVVNLHWRLP